MGGARSPHRWIGVRAGVAAGGLLGVVAVVAVGRFPLLVPALGVLGGVVGYFVAESQVPRDK